jgi:hypothetical protein
MQTAQPSIDNDNHTMTVIQRPLDSCDAEDTPVYLNVERSIIWAYDYTVDWDHAKPSLANFTAGIVTGVRLYTDNSTAAGASIISDPQVKTLNLNMSGYVVPPSLSSVTCVNFALPNDTTYHVVEYTGFSTTSFVTRLAGYVCAPSVVPPQPVRVPYDCSGETLLTRGLPVVPVGCETLNFIWVPGAKTFRAPAAAGFLIGSGGPTVVVLQAYYLNRKGAVNQVRIQAAYCLLCRRNHALLSARAHDLCR